ncbi:MBL fold metallo-hydrolase [Mumia sp. zg.B17]|uniref:MBL fold metallo-hydrolase n=1 Tax=Mumia sp. zg.B17 TaxID=2855446 RepID=UPI001C6E0385|nr:MBL fold metallo-hydrolase [Mumia sp. zg.B17]MBW9206512.1 MBL fold metallo-hydrolase [Mumia sp. zg.B17]
MNERERLVEVADGVLVITHPFCATTTTVVVGHDGRECVVVDPGVTADEIDALATALASRGLTVTGAFSTHPHWDHLLWRPSLGDAPRWATDAGAARALAVVDDNARKARAAVEEVDTSGLGRVVALEPGAIVLPWTGRHVRVLEHRAHAPGHAALMVTDVGVLVAGDMLSDVEIPLLDLEAGRPWDDYAEALDVFDEVARSVAVVVPGHGSTGDGVELRRRIDTDRAYLASLPLEGEGDPDPRLAGAADWLLAEHEAAGRRVRHDLGAQ